MSIDKERNLSVDLNIDKKFDLSRSVKSFVLKVFWTNKKNKKWIEIEETMEINGKKYLKRDFEELGRLMDQKPTFEPLLLEDDLMINDMRVRDKTREWYYVTFVTKEKESLIYSIVVHIHQNVHWLNFTINVLPKEKGKGKFEDFTNDHWIDDEYKSVSFVSNPSHLKEHPICAFIENKTNIAKDYGVTREDMIIRPHFRPFQQIHYELDTDKEKAIWKIKNLLDDGLLWEINDTNKDSVDRFINSLYFIISWQMREFYKTGRYESKLSDVLNTINNRNI